MTVVEEIVERASLLTDEEKVVVANQLLAQVCPPKKEHLELWGREVLARHEALRQGLLTSMPYEEFAERYRTA